MNEQQMLGRLPGRSVIHVLRTVSGTYIPACFNSYSVRNPVELDKQALSPTCRRCQRK